MTYNHPTGTAARLAKLESIYEGVDNGPGLILVIKSPSCTCIRPEPTRGQSIQLFRCTKTECQSESNTEQDHEQQERAQVVRLSAKPTQYSTSTKPDTESELEIA
jgi:hypothetical protein